MRSLFKLGLLSLLLLGEAATATTWAQITWDHGVNTQSTASDGSRRNDTQYERLAFLCDSLQDALNLTDFDVVPVEHAGERVMRHLDETALQQTLIEIYAALGLEADLPDRFSPVSLRIIFDEILSASATSTATVQTRVADGLTSSLAILRGAVTDDGGQALTAWGFKFGTNSDLSDSIHVAFGDYQSFLDTSAQDTGAFMLEKSGLDRYTTYYYAAWAENGSGIVQGETRSFTTLPDLASGLSLDTSLVTATSATLELAISDAGGQGPDDVGFYWDDVDFTLDAFAGDSLPSDSASGTAHSVQVTGLTRMTTYYFNAYADNLAGRAWADAHFAFTTKPEVPEFDTLYADLTVDSLYALLADDGGQTPTLSRFIYSTTSNAELVTDSVDGVPNGLSFSAPLASASLLPSQDYELYASAENDGGQATSDTANFYTAAFVQTIDSVADLTSSTASLFASFAFGNRTPDAFGFKWGLGGDLSDATVSPVALAADSTIRLDLDGLSDGSTYYYAAYADNGIVQFGDTLSFVPMNLSAPTVLADTVLYSHSSRGTLNGVVDNDGGADVTGFGFIWGTDASLADATEVVGDSTSATGFSKALTGLDPETTYYYSAYATNAVGTGYSDTLSFSTLAGVIYDGYTYGVVQIGSQRWLAENLRNDNYADGSPIPGGLDDATWASDVSGAQAIYDGDSATYFADYGRLYNWHAVNNASGLCPTGWHVPDTTDFWSLMTFSFSIYNQAYMTPLKSSPSDTPSWDGDNSFGFSLFPKGSRTLEGTYNLGGGMAELLWTSSSADSSDAYTFMFGSIFFLPGQIDKRAGLGVRCIQDPESAPTVSTSTAVEITESSATLTGTIEFNGGSEITAAGFQWSNAADLSGGTEVNVEAVEGELSADLTDLTAGDTVYFAAFATNAIGTSFGDTLSFVPIAPAACTSVTFDGYVYDVVEIGSQCWFAENLRSDNYADGSPIPGGLDDAAWASDVSGAQAIYDGDSATYYANYGRLYNWHAVNNTSGLCPDGWHVPEADEIDTLLAAAYLSPSALSALQAPPPSWEGSNSLGFSAVPSGARDTTGAYGAAGQIFGLWSSSIETSTTARTVLLVTGAYAAFPGSLDKRGGLSVRCLQGERITTPAVSTSSALEITDSTATLMGAIQGNGGFEITAAGFKWSNSADLSGGTEVIVAELSGEISTDLTGLTLGNTVYYAAFATNANGTSYGDTLSFVPTACTSITYDGYEYGTVRLGNQCWFTQNLRTDKYADGTSIPGGLDDAAWSATTSGAQAIYAGDSATYFADNGRLYNWYAVNDAAGLCPTGWHVPTRDEFHELRDYLGDSNAGEQMKSSPSDVPAWDGTNTSGFSAVPGGTRSAVGSYSTTTANPRFWWTATQVNTTAWRQTVTGGLTTVSEGADSFINGYSVRCLRIQGVE